MKAALRSQGVELPSDWDDNLLLRQVYGTNWKTRNAVAAVLKHLEWRKTAMPPDYKILFPTVLPLLHSGCLYIHGRDCRYRPCIIMQYPRFNFREHSIDEYLPLIGFFLDYVIDNMMLPGQIETWVSITDMGKMGLSDLPISQLRKVIEVLQNNYKCRLGRNFVVNAPTSVNVVWTIVKKFLDKDTVEKMSITGKSFDPALLQNFHPSQIEEKYGGQAPNLTTFWPPIVPDSPFEAPGMQPGELLSQKSSYKEPVSHTHYDAPMMQPHSERLVEEAKVEPKESITAVSSQPAQASASTKESYHDSASMVVFLENPCFASPPPQQLDDQPPPELELKYPEELKTSEEFEEKAAIPILNEPSNKHSEARIVIEGAVPASFSCCGVRGCTFQKSSMCVLF